jgi:hypothetical protein
MAYNVSALLYFYQPYATIHSLVIMRKKHFTFTFTALLSVMKDIMGKQNETEVSCMYTQRSRRVYTVDDNNNNNNMGCCHLS